MEVYTDYEKAIDMDKLYGWWFTYSPFIQQWMACKTEDREAVYNDYSSPKVIKSKKIETLQELIIRSNGNIEEMNKICIE